MQTKKFRDDINGLRAYAVILVVLFHFGVSGFSAGFLGVDIFFVISGYLMTKIIIENFESNRFSFIEFYLARITRIFPALFFLVITMTLIGWFFFIPDDFKLFAKDAEYSLNFLSNNLYYRQAGDYFAVSTHDKALLHTWSLSVEWQFYILFPIFTYIYFKIFKNIKYLGIFLILICIASLGFSIYISSKDAMYAFFKLTTRAWELIAGGLVYYYFRTYTPSSAFKLGFEFFGFACIALSLILFDQDTLWPSYPALLPIIGTMCILIANQQNSIFTKPKIIQSIGSASYSIYLWHWPIAFLLGYFFVEKTPLNISLAICISLLLGWLSYKYIESSRKYLIKLNTLYCYLLFIGILIFSAQFYSYIEKNGVEDRADSIFLSHSKMLEMPKMSNGWCFYNIKDDHSLKVGNKGLECHIASNSTNAKSALLFGDSFAGHNIPFWDHLGKKLNLNINAITTNWCYPSIDQQFTGDKASTAYQQCMLNRTYLKNHIHQYDVLIFAGRWSDIVKQNQQQSFENILKIAQQSHQKVIVMSEPYAFDENISLLYKRSLWLHRDFNLNNYFDNIKATEQKSALKLMTEMVQRYPNTLLLNQSDLFKPNHMAGENLPYSLDGRHLSVYGSLASEQYFVKQPKYLKLQQFIRQP